MGLGWAQFVSNGKEPTKACIVIKDAVAAQCTQFFGKHVEIVGIDRE